ncbi:hypothetical protein AGMMS49531_01610 [Endomicrobiia bacterium]|nr:hypothetical protein AGMMS49531_01610 [Endomicrobiia bacterium]
MEDSTNDFDEPMWVLPDVSLKFLDSTYHTNVPKERDQLKKVVCEMSDEGFMPLPDLIFKKDEANNGSVIWLVDSDENRPTQVGRV